MSTIHGDRSDRILHALLGGIESIMRDPKRHSHIAMHRLSTEITQSVHAEVPDATLGEINSALIKADILDAYGRAI